MVIRFIIFMSMVVLICGCESTEKPQILWQDLYDKGSDNI